MLMSTWQKFLKKNSGKGYSIPELAKMYHKKPTTKKRSTAAKRKSVSYEMEWEVTLPSKRGKARSVRGAKRGRVGGSLCRDSKGRFETC